MHKSIKEQKLYLFDHLIKKIKRLSQYKSVEEIRNVVYDNLLGEISIEGLIAWTLYCGGAKKVYMCTHFRAGRSLSVRDILLWNTSFTVAPYIKFENQPLLWFVLKNLKIPMSGGASEGHGMQASWHPHVCNVDIHKIVAIFGALRSTKFSRNEYDG